MIDGLKPYAAIAYISVPWADEAPEHWRIMPSLATFEEIRADSRALEKETERLLGEFIRGSR